MQTYLELAEFCKLVHLNEDAVKGMIANGALNFKEEDGKIYIEANQGTFSVVPSGTSEAAPISSISLAGESFVEKTIGTILNLHEKVLDAKDETLDTLKNENKFLKDALYSMQDIYDEDRKTIDILNEQLARAQEEVEFLKRKYKLMWNKAVDNFTQGKEKSGVDELKDELGEVEPNGQSAAAQGAENVATPNSTNSTSTTSAINAAKAAQSVSASANLSANSTASVNSTANSASNSPNSSASTATNSATPNTTPNLVTAQNSASEANLSALSATTQTSTLNSTTPNLNANSTPSATSSAKAQSANSANPAPNANSANVNPTPNANLNAQNSATPNAAPSANSSASGVSNPNLKATSNANLGANSTLNSATSGAKQ